ncbi:hypothetical protein BDY21DRAFT_375046 [Lineolata rhizophorae]|uniref:Uncharacterized protein n=1 Tax=Lineolata rhizophorae TaxID=578093 RepID=A0A6A6NMP7_9PEZI|nr:hypothetical protein BDY21DRAFT_375046 [Lineolata rhizophorae]
MPEIIERDGGARVVYVHPSSRTVEIERERKRMARERERIARKEERQKEEEGQKEKEKEAKVTTDVATAVDEKAEGDAERPAQSKRPIGQVDAEEAPEAVNVPAGAPSMVLEDDDNEPVSAYNMELGTTAGIGKATAAAEKLPSAHEAEPTEAEVETTHLVQGATVQLTEGVLDKMSRMENPAKAIKRWRAPSKGPGADEGVDEGVDEDGRTCVSDGSHGDAETAQTVQTAQVDTRSMFSRFFG